MAKAQGTGTVILFDHRGDMVVIDADATITRPETRPMDPINPADWRVTFTVRLPEPWPSILYRILDEPKTHRLPWLVGLAATMAALVALLLQL